MRSAIVAAMISAVAAQASAQEMAPMAERMHKPYVMTNDWGVSACSVSPQAGEPVLSVQIDVHAGAGGGPHVKRAGVDAGSDAAGGIDASGVSADFTIDGSGVAPTVTAHAINTKGTGGTNHRAAAQSCVAPSGLLLPAVQKREARAVPACRVSGDDKLLKFLITTPLSAFGAGAKTGHVTINRRGEAAADGALIVPCDQADGTGAANRPIRAGWDIKVAKPM
ncbi:hypothetical protein [Novosphingobium sp.]|uniref:hypothetical protein n=1 Tax=Novosphingobium sp. TaxID=1874826 RepID=UPI003341BBCD